MLGLFQNSPIGTPASPNPDPGGVAVTGRQDPFHSLYLTVLLLHWLLRVGVRSCIFEMDQRSSGAGSRAAFLTTHHGSHGLGRSSPCFLSSLFGSTALRCFGVDGSEKPYPSVLIRLTICSSRATA